MGEIRPRKCAGRGRRDHLGRGAGDAARGGVAPAAAGDRDALAAAAAAVAPRRVRAPDLFPPPDRSARERNATQPDRSGRRTFHSTAVPCSVRRSDSQLSALASVAARHPLTCKRPRTRLRSDVVLVVRIRAEVVAGGVGKRRTSHQPQLLSPAHRPACAPPTSTLQPQVILARRLTALGCVVTVSCCWQSCSAGQGQICMPDSIVSTPNSVWEMVSVLSS